MIFVATTLFVNGKLWTGDKVLYKGLRALNFKDIFDSADINN